MARGEDSLKRELVRRRKITYILLEPNLRPAWLSLL